MAATATTQWILELVDKITGPMKGVAKVAEDAAKGVDGIGEKADNASKNLKKLSAIDLFAISDAVGRVTDTFDKAMEPGIRFNAQMKEVEAITGVSGRSLDELGEKARKTAKAFGGDASAMMESYKGILSRLGPDIAKNQPALEQMGIDIATLSKTMGGDAVGAMDALTTSMLQMGVDLSDPVRAASEMTRMMNVMAAGAKEGASEVTQIGEAYKQAGVQVKNSNVSFEEGNAALQALAQGGKYGSEAGVALRNVLGKMSGLDVIPKEAQGKIKALGINFDIVSDKSLPLTTRLKELSKAQQDSTLIAQIFGVENAAAAEILLRSTDYQDQLRQKITGTNVATEQASVIMSGYGEWLSRVKAWISDLGIGFFNTAGSILPFVDGLGMSVMMLANFANAKSGVMMLFNGLKTMPIVSTIVSGGFAGMGAAAKTFGVAIMNIPIVGWIAALIAGIIALGVYMYNGSANMRGILFGLWESIKAVFNGIFAFIWAFAKAVWNTLRSVFDPTTWFDKNWSFMGKMAEFSKETTAIGRSIGESFARGRKEGEASYYKSHPDEDPAKIASDKKKKTRLAELTKQYEALNGKSGKEAESLRANIVTKMNAISPNSGTNLQIKNVAPGANLPPITKPTKGGDTATGGGGSAGGGGVKNINQKIEIKNNFYVDKNTNVEAIAAQVVRFINDQLSNSVIVSKN
jgi:phage tail tape measure protein, TP901 family, core region